MNATNQKSGVLQYTNKQLTVLVFLRVLVGWHILYEGMVKLFSSNWSSAGYLMDSQWIFTDFFQSLAANNTILGVVDFVNIWGLIFIGLGLILGAFTRVAAIGGAILLLMYYLSHPPLVGLKYSMPTEGSYLIVNKTLIEAFVLIALSLFPTSQIIGIDRLINKMRGKPAPDETPLQEDTNQEKAATV